jgi:hypothetical protein
MSVENAEKRLKKINTNLELAMKKQEKLTAAGKKTVAVEKEINNLIQKRTTTLRTTEAISTSDIFVPKTPSAPPIPGKSHIGVGSEISGREAKHIAHRFRSVLHQLETGKLTPRGVSSDILFGGGIITVAGQKMGEVGQRMGEAFAQRISGLAESFYNMPDAKQILMEHFKKVSFFQDARNIWQNRHVRTEVSDSVARAIIRSGALRAMRTGAGAARGVGAALGVAGAAASEVAPWLMAAYIGGEVAAGLLTRTDKERMAKSQAIMKMESTVMDLAHRRLSPDQVSRLARLQSGIGAFAGKEVSFWSSGENREMAMKVSHEAWNLERESQGKRRIEWSPYQREREMESRERYGDCVLQYGQDNAWWATVGRFAAAPGWALRRAGTRISEWWNGVDPEMEAEDRLQKKAEKTEKAVEDGMKHELATFAQDPKYAVRNHYREEIFSAIDADRRQNRMVAPTI